MGPLSIVSSVVACSATDAASQPGLQSTIYLLYDSTAAYNVRWTRLFHMELAISAIPRHTGAANTVVLYGKLCKLDAAGHPGGGRATIVGPLCSGLLSPPRFVFVYYVSIDVLGLCRKTSYA